MMNIHCTHKGCGYLYRCGFFLVTTKPPRQRIKQSKANYLFCRWWQLFNGIFFFGSVMKNGSKKVHPTGFAGRPLSLITFQFHSLVVSISDRNVISYLVYLICYLYG